MVGLHEQFVKVNHIACEKYWIIAKKDLMRTFDPDTLRIQGNML